MKWYKSAGSVLLAMAFSSFWGSGCSGGGQANQVRVAVSGAFSVMVPTQTQTLTAIVTGATDVSATFACTFTTTPFPTTATPNPMPSAPPRSPTANGASA